MIPKEYWIIEPYGEVECIKTDRHWSEDLYNQFKKFGNCFETREEAEKAVEKLKAWKRLEEARIRFKDYHYELEDNDALITYKLEIEADGFAYEDFTDDLKLLFGGEK